jgi:hypothetical protein
MSAVSDALADLNDSVTDTVAEVQDFVEDTGQAVIDEVVTPVVESVQKTYDAFEEDPVGTSLKIAAAASGRKPNFATLVPNLVLASGLLKMLPKITIAPTKEAEEPKKLKPPTKPIAPIIPKNLFAEGAAGSALSTLKQPLSAFMGLMSTIAPLTNLIADSPAKTSYGSQKLSSNANTVNWGSGGYGRDDSKQSLEQQRMEISAKIEKHTAELLEQIDYTKLTKYSYGDLIKKYPEIKSTSTVAEALHIIDVADKAAAAKANTAATMTA